MSCLYCFTLLLVLFSIFNIRKINKKVSLFVNLFFSIIIMMCYISTSSFIVDKLGISLNYNNCIIVNLIVTFVLMFLTLKKKLKQEMFFDKGRLLNYSIFFLIIAFILFYTFGFDFNVAFYSPDAAAHFLSSRYFSLSHELNAEINLINSQAYSNGFQFFFYTNLGTIFKCLPNLSIIGQYKVFAIYNFFIFYMLAISFFEILMLRTKTKNQRILATIITILFFCGYPLNVTLYGFSYWNTGILLCQAIIYVLLISRDINKNVINYILALLLFSLFCSYYLFVPIMYFCVFIYFIKEEYRDRKFYFKNFIIRCLISLVIPFVLGFCYFVLESLLSDVSGYVSGIGLEGTIFVDIISNYLLLIPIVLFAVVEKKGEKKDFLNNIFLYNIVYVIILFAFSILNVLSAYYFSKILYLNWALMWLLTYKGIIKLNKFVPDFTKIYAFIYILLFLLVVFGINDKILEKKEHYNDVMILDNLFSIYKWNIEYIKKPSVYFNNDDLKLINTYVGLENVVNDKNETNFIGSYVQKRWFESLTDIYPYVDYGGNVIIYYLPTSFQLWERSKECDYILINKKTELVDGNLKDILKKYTIYKESDNLVIIQKIKKS